MSETFLIHAMVRLKTYTFGVTTSCIYRPVLALSTNTNEEIVAMAVADLEKLDSAEVFTRVRLHAITPAALDYLNEDPEKKQSDYTPHYGYGDCASYWNRFIGDEHEAQY